MTLILPAVLTAVLLILAVIFYLWKANYYKTHFLPNTYINSVDCSELNVAEVTEILKADTAGYAVTVPGRNEAGEKSELGTVYGDEIGLEAIDAAGVAAAVLYSYMHTGFPVICYY